MGIERPLDALNAARGKKVIAELKNKTTVSGTLVSFDIHINLVLDDVEQYVEGELKKKFERILIRGDMVVMVSPVK